MPEDVASAQFDVFCPGMLEVLSIGRGDLKLVIDDSSPEDIARARDLIREMMRKGYMIFVDTDEGPVRVKRFSAKRMTYIIQDPPPGSAPEPTRKRREVPVRGSRSTAVGRTAGG